MKANYHTHTARCGHATGTDEDYVLAAIEQGFDELGFSDHVPWPYQDGYTHPSVRMRVDQMPGYLNSVRALAAQYKDKIHILTGFDDEYGMYFGNIRTAAQLRRYVDSAVKGLETGLFSYLAHPDLFMRDYGKPFDENGRVAARELCQACKALDIPMEYNLHDRFLSPVTHRRSYPDAHFFEIVRQEGVRVLIGVDAHGPEEIRNPAQWALASRELEPFGALFEDRLCL